MLPRKIRRTPTYSTPAQQNCSIIKKRKGVARGSIGGGALSDVEVPIGPPVVPLDYLDGYRSIQPFLGRASAAVSPGRAGARIALISAKPHNPLADEFLKQSVFFETKVRA
jgi:hypothetical protein